MPEYGRVTGSERMRNAARLWREHRTCEFPARLRGAEVDGIDLVMLDTDTAGCVHAWIRDGGVLDPERGRILRTCIEDLDRVTARISDPTGRHYYERLHRLAVLVAKGHDTV